MDNQEYGLNKAGKEDGDADDVAEMMAKFVQQRLSTVNDDQSEIGNRLQPEIVNEMSSDGDSSIENIKVMKANPL